MSRYLDTPNRTPVQAATVTLADLATLPIWAPRGKVKDPKHRRAPVNPKSAAGAWPLSATRQHGPPLKRQTARPRPLPMPICAA